MNSYRFLRSPCRWRVVSPTPQRLSEMIKWNDWKASAALYGGDDAWAKVHQAKESHATELNLTERQIKDLYSVDGFEGSMARRQQDPRRSGNHTPENAAN
ncbi:MAG: hypothetical protein VB980_02885 [Opitutales bacterium]